MGTLERKERDLARRRELILVKSRELFSTRGFDNVTVQDICEAVEYGKSAVYALFDSKEEIYGRISIEGLNILHGLLLNTDETLPVEEQLLAAVDALLAFFRDHTEYYRAIFFFPMKGSAYEKLPPKLLEEKGRHIEKVEFVMRNIIRRGMDEGLFRHDDEAQLVQLFWTSLTGIIGSISHRQSDVDFEYIRDMCIKHARLYINSLKA